MEQNKLPAGWSWVKLGEVSIDIRYGYTASSSQETNGPKFLRITDIQDSKVDWSKVPYCTIEDEIVNKYLLQENDIVFARTGATVGKSFLIKGQVPKSVFASYLIRLQLSEYVLPLYVYLFFQSSKYWVQIKESSAGIGQPNVNAAKLKNLEIPLPPLREQQKIVEKIEELFSELDNGVANLKKAKEQIKVYKQSVLKYAFEGKLVEGKMQYGKGKSENGGLPEGWKWRKLGEISDIINGYAFKSSHFSTDGDYQVIKIGNVRPINLRLEERPAFVSDVDQKIREKYLLRNNDLVISLTGTRKKRDYGFVALVKQSDLLLLNQRLAAIRLIENYNPLYFLYLLSINIFLDQFFSYETGNVGQGNVGIKGIKESVLPIPPLSEQTQIVEEIERRFSVADKMEAVIDESLKKSEGMRQSILKQAFEGKLV